MRKLWLVLLFAAIFSACAQTPSETFSSPEKENASRSVRRKFLYRVKASSNIVGFNIMVNGAEIANTGGGAVFSSETNINDWMVSGNNKIEITVFWPENVSFTPSISSASFKLYSNDKMIKEFKWPESASPPDKLNSYPHTFTENFKADGFPRVLLERAERIISSAGALPRSDQEEIAEIAGQLRTAFTEKNISLIEELFRFKYTDLATARFSTTAEIRNEANEKYRELMDKPGYTIIFNGRNSFFTAADDRAVRLGQGRIGFPQPALIISYREGRSTARFELELYFAKIDGKWVIIR